MDTTYQDPFSLHKLDWLGQYSPAVMRLWTLSFNRNDNPDIAIQHGDHYDQSRNLYTLKDDFSGFHGRVYLCAIGLLGAATPSAPDYQRVIGVAPTWCSKENYLKPKGEA